jgi:uncharacterized cupredoxin-like copper-binding protein
MKKIFPILILLIILVVVLFLGFNTITGNAVAVSSNEDVKEFSINSYYDDTGVWFSLKEINVNKGDKVRIKVTNIKGNHDFVIEEYKINEVTPLNQEVVIEFTADKAGEFTYYCSVPGHREKGQWGTLTVLS